MKRMISISAPLRAVFFTLALTLVLSSCQPDPGPGGAATIEGTTNHHSTPVPWSKVYIKYDSEGSPGTDPAVYDDSTTSDADAVFSFSGLNKGNYYLRGVGFDSTIGFPVSAGIPVEIAKKNETVTVLIPVTE